MRTSNARMTARIIRTEDSKTFPGYEVGDASDPSPEAVQAALEAHYHPPKS